MTAAGQARAGLDRRLGRSRVPAVRRCGDAEDLPLGRLLRLSLFQVSVGMAAVLLTGHAEPGDDRRARRPGVAGRADGVAAAAVRAVPRADRLPLGHPPLGCSAGGACPIIWFGTLLQFGGLAIMPFALIVLSGRQHAARPGPARCGAALAFLLVGAGHAHDADGGPRAGHRPARRTSAAARRGAALRDAAGRHGGQRARLRPLLRDFTPLRLIQVIQGAAVRDHGAQHHRAVEAGRRATPADARARRAAARASATPGRSSWRRGRARRLLVAVALGTAGLQHAGRPARTLWRPDPRPVGVGATTLLTALLALGALVGFALAARRLLARARSLSPRRHGGVLVGHRRPSRRVIFAGAAAARRALFCAGTLLIGFGGGLFAVGTLTAAMAMPRERPGRARPRARRLGRGAGDRRRARHRDRRRRARRRRRFVAANGGLGPALADARDRLRRRLPHRDRAAVRHAGRARSAGPHARRPRPSAGRSSASPNCRPDSDRGGHAMQR